jgi:hypothetical protein
VEIDTRNCLWEVLEEYYKMTQPGVNVCGLMMIIGYSEFEI